MACKETRMGGGKFVPRDMQREFFVKYTMAGRAKKKKLKQTE